MATNLLSGFRVSVQYREPYVSEALNEKFSAVPRGIVRGAIPEPGVANDTLLITPDPMTGETVIVASGMASTAGGLTNVFPVTYRTNTQLALTIPSDGNLHFIYLCGGYQPLATTTPAIRDYSEAEFETNDPDADGGVLLCVVQANAAPGVLGSDQIMYAGMSNTASVPFRRHLQCGFESGQYASNVETVESYVNFSFLSAKSAMVFASATPDVATTMIWQAGNTPVSNGYMRFQPGGPDVGSLMFSVASPAFMVRQSGSLPRKIRLEIVYRTVGVYVLTIGACGLAMLTNDATNPGGTLVPTPFAPTIAFPSAVAANWSLFVTEFDLPVDVSGDQLATLGPLIAFTLAGGGIDIASVSYTMTAGVQNPAQLELADGLGSLVPASYGALAGFTEVRNDQVPFTNSAGLLVRSMYAGPTGKGWAIRDRPGQTYPAGFPAGFPDLWIVPEVTDTGNTVNFGSPSAVDVFGGYAGATARLTSVNMYGNAQGATASYALNLSNLPIKVDEIRPSSGFGGIAKRIDVRASNGTVSSPPAYLNSVGTACCTARVRWDSGTSQWVISGVVGSYVNVASVTHVSASEFSLTFTDDINSAAAVVSATFFRAGVHEFFAQVSVLTNTDVHVRIVNAAAGAVAPANNDGVMLVIHGMVI